MVEANLSSRGQRNKNNQEPQAWKHRVTHKSHMHPGEQIKLKGYDLLKARLKIKTSKGTPQIKFQETREKKTKRRKNKEKT